MSLHDQQRIEQRLKSVSDPVGFLINLFTHAPVGFAVWHADGRPLLTNKAFIDLFGSEPPPEYNVLEDDILAASGMLSLFQRAFAGETVHVPTFWFDPRELTVIKMTEGRRVAISMTIFPLFKADGAIDYVAATYKDETEITTSEAKKTAVMNAALDAIIVMDHEGVILDFNPAAERTFGYARAEVIGRKLADTLIPPHLREGHTSGLARYLSTSTPRVIGTRVELSALHRDGHEFPAEIAVVRIGGEGAPLFTGYIRDITERKRLEETAILRRAKDAAEAANIELQTFSYSVAHDLRAPLRAMSGFGNVLREDYGDKLDAEAHSHIDRISDAASRMGQQIDGLLALASITKRELTYETVDLGKVTREIGAQLADPSRSVTWKVEDGMVVRGDPALLYMVMQNLLGNAWKFSAGRSDAHIEVGRVEVDGGIAYFVKDNGVGFDHKYVGQLFQPFRRLHRSDEFEGTGIGLATVERIIRRHGGRIWVNSAVGAGATFYFTL